MKIGIIGAGNLGKGLLDSMTGKDLNISISSKNPGTYKGIEILSDNKKVVLDSDIIILAVKPQSMEEVIDEIKSYVEDKIVISFAAGLRSEYFESKLDANIVRAMTNLAIRNDKGMTVYKLNRSFLREDKKKVENILKNLGKCVETEDEGFLDVVTAISGSGIAYFIKIIDTFIESTKSLGVSEELAQEIVMETVRGAISLIEESEVENEEIIKCIASKGGTTEKGLKEMEEKKLDESLKKIITTTIEKCKSMGD